MHRALTALLLASLLAPLASGHPFGDGGFALTHGFPASAALASGEEMLIPISFGPQPFAEGWLWTVYGSVEGADVLFRMEHHNDTVQEWIWQPGEMRAETGRFPEEGFYELRLRNLGAENATFSFSYDQSCACSYKPIPFNGGYAWANAPLEKGEAAHFELLTNVVNVNKVTRTDKPAYNLDITLYRIAAGAESEWPASFQVLDHWQVPGPAWEVNVTADVAGTYFLLVRTNLDAPDPADPWRFVVIPFVEIEEAAVGTPSPGVLIVLPLVALVAWLRRR